MQLREERFPGREIMIFAVMDNMMEKEIALSLKKIHIAVLSQEVGCGKTWHIIYSGKRDRGTNVRMDLLDTWVLEL